MPDEAIERVWLATRGREHVVSSRLPRDALGVFGAVRPSVPKNSQVELAACCALTALAGAQSPSLHSKLHTHRPSSETIAFWGRQFRPLNFARERVTMIVPTPLCS